MWRKQRRNIDTTKTEDGCCVGECDVNPIYCNVWFFVAVLLSVGFRKVVLNLAIVGFWQIVSTYRYCGISQSSRPVYFDVWSCPCSACWPQRYFERPQLFYLNPEMVLKQGICEFGSGSKATFYCILRDHWKNLRDHFGLSKLI